MGAVAAVKLGLSLFAFLAALGGGWWFIDHEREVGAAQCVADVKVAVDKEKERQTGLNQFWYSWGVGAIASADQQKAKMDDLEKQVADASAGLKSRTCLPASVGDRMRAIDLPGDKADPASPASRAHR